MIHRGLNIQNCLPRKYITTGIDIIKNLNLAASYNGFERHYYLILTTPFRSLLLQMQFRLMIFILSLFRSNFTLKDC